MAVLICQNAVNSITKMMNCYPTLLLTRVAFGVLELE